jgi:hypothetical protein
MKKIISTTVPSSLFAVALLASTAAFAGTAANAPVPSAPASSADQKPSTFEKVQGQAPGGGNQGKGRDMQKEYGLKKNNANSGGGNAGTPTGGEGGDGQGSGAGGS